MIKNNKIGVKKGIIYFILFFIVFSLIMDIINMDSSQSDNLTNVKQANGFTISNYDVILDVNKDNKVDVTENITVNYTQKNHHGIYRYIPEWLEYTDKNNKTIKRRTIISNLRSENEVYDTYNSNNKAVIKIGSEDIYTNLGEKTYNIKYTYDMGEDPFNGFDEFIFYAFGDYWGTTFNNATIKVNMPKSIEGYNINFFTDKNRLENVNKYVDYTIDKNTLYISFNNNKYEQDFNKKLSKALTIDVELPDGYFENGSSNYGYISLIILLIIFIVTIYVIFKWNKYGRDYKIKVEDIEFYPPKNMNAAEVGYIYGKQTNKKLTLAILVQLASKGYIKIDEIEKDKKQIQITNLVPKKPRKIAEFNLEKIPKEIIVKKLKNEDNILSSDEYSLMKSVFVTNNDTVILKNDFEKFDKVKDGLISKGYINIVEDNKLSNIDINKEKYEEKKRRYNEKLDEYNKIIDKLPSLTELETTIYNRLFNGKNPVILSEHKTFYKAFNSVDANMTTKLKNIIYDNTSIKKMNTSIVLTIIIVILHFISYTCIEDLSPKLNFLYSISSFCILLNVILTILMKRRTKYGQDLNVKINKFRNFLITVDNQKLKELVDKDPNYFYEILPYAYVLNVSKKWIRNFENISYAKKDMGNFDYSNDISYQEMYSMVYYPAPIYNSKSSSSSSIGGCSSCGGGCSSCGGGGSW